MESKQKEHRRFNLGFWFILGVALLTPSASANAPPCLVYSFTESGTHQFLVNNNTSNFGDNLTVIHNCEQVRIEMDGQFFALLETNAVIPISPGLHSFNFTFDNQTMRFDNVMFYPDYLNWESNYQFNVFPNNEPMVEKSIIDAQLNWAVFFGIGITWILCVYVYWNLINTFTQRNFIEEVLQ
jgi:hypothetical protein